MNPDGGGLMRITTNPACDVAPNWSPDAERIVFGRDVRADCGGTMDLYVMQADGSGELRLITTPNRWEFHAAWSPQGDRIVFDSCPTEPVFCLIYTMNPTGGDIKQLTSNLQLHK